MDIDYELLPEHMRGAARRYIETGIPPGSFLQAVICNDLREALGRADHINAANMQDIVGFFYNEAPSQCWGSLENMKTWIQLRNEEREKVEQETPTI